MPQLKKQIEYPTIGRVLPGYVKYAIWDGTYPKKCVFSGITRGTTSTINACEGIVAAILSAEGINSPKDVEFYDLLTRCGYGGHAPGVFQFVRLKVTVKPGKVADIYWDWNVRCPSDVIATFRDYIAEEADNPVQVMNPALGTRVSADVPLPNFRP